MAEQRVTSPKHRCYPSAVFWGTCAECGKPMCDRCGGTGQINVETIAGRMRDDCPKCKGTGKNG